MIHFFFSTAAEIMKGDIISLSYTQPLKSTLDRRLHLKEAKCFDCFCDRCKDPTEFGLYASSIMCTSCKSGKVRKKLSLIN